MSLMQSPNSPLATDEYVDGGGEIIQATEVTAIEAMTRAETDVQIVTAKRFPRSIDRFMAMTKALATRNREVAESCFYSKPQGKDKNNKQLYVEGPSIGLANILAYAFGNILVVTRITRESERTITAQALAWDLESNNRAGLEVVRNVWGKYGRYSDDMVKTTCQAAMSIARRNAIFAVVPKPFWQPIYLECRGVASGKGEPFEKRVSGAFSWLASIRVKDAEAFEILQIQGKSDLTEEHMDLLTGFRSAIKEGEATVDQIFRPNVATEHATKTDALTASLKAKVDGAKQNVVQAPEVALAAKQEPVSTPQATSQPEPAKPDQKKDTRSPWRKWLDDAVEATNRKIVAIEPNAKPIDPNQAINHLLDEAFKNRLDEKKNVKDDGKRDMVKCSKSLSVLWDADGTYVQDVVGSYLNGKIPVKPTVKQTSMLGDDDEDQFSDMEGVESMPAKAH